MLGGEMNIDEMLKAAMTLRETAAGLMDQAEEIETMVKIERAKLQPQIGEILVRLIEIDQLKRQLAMKGIL
jgi:hypothetical protein